MGIGDDFATADVFCIYVNAAVDLNPISLQYNIPAFLSDPDAALGARVRVKPSDDFYFSAGVYNADPGTGRNPDVSVNTNFTFGHGVIMISEAGDTPGSDDGSAGLKGEYKICAYYDTGEFDGLSDTGDRRTGRPRH